MEHHLEINKTRYDNKASDVEYKVGQYVWLYNPAVRVGLSNKLQAKWCGPYVIVEVHDNHTYRIRDCQTRLESPTLINGARLKPARLHSESAIGEYIKEQQQKQGIPIIPDRDLRHNIHDKDEANQPNLNDQNTPVPPVGKLVDLARNNR